MENQWISQGIIWEHLTYENNSLIKSEPKLLAYVFAYVSGGASYVFAYVFLHAQLLSAVYCCFVRCMAAGFYWFSIQFSDMLVAAGGSSWLLCHFLPTFALCFAYGFLTLKTARTKPCENHCLANGNMKHRREHNDLRHCLNFQFVLDQMHTKTLWEHTKAI